MWNPEADKARDLAKACRSLEKNSRSRKPDDARTEDFRAQTVLAMSELLDEFGLGPTAAEVADKLIEFADIHAVLHLQSSKSLSVSLFVLKNGEIALRSRERHPGRVVFREHSVGVRDSQIFYENMLHQLDYERPGPKRALERPRRLRFHKSSRHHKEPCSLSYPISPDRDERWKSVGLSRKHALELCQILAEPLGWELEG